MNFVATFVACMFLLSKPWVYAYYDLYGQYFAYIFTAVCFVVANSTFCGYDFEIPIPHLDLKSIEFITMMMVIMIAELFAYIFGIFERVCFGYTMGVVDLKVYQFVMMYFFFAILYEFMCKLKANNFTQPGSEIGKAMCDNSL